MTILFAASTVKLSAATTNCEYSDTNTDYCLNIQVHDQHGNNLGLVASRLCARAD